MTSTRLLLGQILVVLSIILLGPWASIQRLASGRRCSCGQRRLASRQRPDAELLRAWAMGRSELVRHQLFLPRDPSERLEAPAPRARATNSPGLAAAAVAFVPRVGQQLATGVRPSEGEERI